ncbi:hypothetical protein [Agrococcus casei]|uniref:Uncharacterized protein n=1 Tax=Agrococcus casei LMG 22410 TaxID=1255656 RepID=A0A1R4FE69_9MICO|nr:hypothetical protein [Agrococcus casei]SJM54101.1 hypothetical protein CZ674_04095 [Agrococcus casei LMG 22410]
MFDSLAYSQTAKAKSPAPAPGVDAKEIYSDMQIVAGSPTTEEAAAVEAVLTEMAAEWGETKHRKVLG